MGVYTIAILILRKPYRQSVFEHLVEIEDSFSKMYIKWVVKGKEIVWAFMGESKARAI